MGSNLIIYGMNFIFEFLASVRLEHNNSLSNTLRKVFVHLTLQKTNDLDKVFVSTGLFRIIISYLVSMRKFAKSRSIRRCYASFNTHKKNASRRLISYEQPFYHSITMIDVRIIKFIHNTY